MAVESATQAEKDGVDVAFIDLSAARDMQVAASTIAVALDVRETPERAMIDALVADLDARPRLVILDNLEQIDGAPGLVSELLAALQTRVLATSRIPLRLMGEIEVAIPPLALPVEGSPAGSPARPRGRCFWHARRRSDVSANSALTMRKPWPSYVQS